MNIIIVHKFVILYSYYKVVSKYVTLLLVQPPWSC